MKKNQLFSSIFILTIFSFVIVTACKKDAAPANAAPNYSWNEEFDTLANSFAKGWAAINNSRPIGLSTWNQASIEALDAKGKAFVPSYPFSAQSAVYFVQRCGYAPFCCATPDTNSLNKNGFKKGLISKIA